MESNKSRVSELADEFKKAAESTGDPEVIKVVIEAIDTYFKERQEKIRAWRANEIEKEKANYKKANKRFNIILLISVVIAFAGLLLPKFYLLYLIVVGLLPFGIIYGAISASTSALRLHHLAIEEKRDKDLSA